MELHTIQSKFHSLPIEIFWYPAKNKATATIFLLKGLYGVHDPKANDSWEVALIRASLDNFNFVCINSAREGKTSLERSNKEAFIGKAFSDECTDIQDSVTYILNKKNGISSSKLYFIGNSFGGTTLLGIPETLNKASGIIFIGSGCGKSPTTTKPLLTTLYDESLLLNTIASYSGVFAFVRGSLDSVVPMDSQYKIIESAKSARINILFTVNNAQHDLSSDEKTTPNRTTLLISIINNVISFAM